MRLSRRSCFCALTASLCCFRNSFCVICFGTASAVDPSILALLDDDTEFVVLMGVTPSLTNASDVVSLALERRLALQLLLQHVTSSHTRSHFFLHVKGRLQTTHTLDGRLFLAITLPGPLPLASLRIFKLVVDDIQWILVDVSIAVVEAIKDGENLTRVGRNARIVGSARWLFATATRANTTI